MLSDCSQSVSSDDNSICPDYTTVFQDIPVVINGFGQNDDIHQRLEKEERTLAQYSKRGAIATM